MPLESMLIPTLNSLQGLDCEHDSAKRAELYEGYRKKPSKWQEKPMKTIIYQ